MRTITYLFILVCFLSSCKKCPTLVLCPAANPSYFEVHGSDTATIYIPNAFTPDGDGINDYFEIYGKNINTATLTTQIYDGNTQVYQVNGLGYGAYWNGVVNGTQSVKLYTVKVRGTSIWGSSIALDGTVSSICRQLVGANDPPITQNTSVNYTHAQFPDQNDNGTYDQRLPNGEYLVKTEVIVCK